MLERIILGSENANWSWSNCAVHG